MTRSHTDTTGDPTALIHALAQRDRATTDEEIIAIRIFLAGRGYEPSGRKRADASVARQALILYGRVLARHELIPIVERDFLKHVAEGQEWPVGTAPDEYVDSLRKTIQDPDGGIFVATIAGRLALTFIAGSGHWSGPGSGGWIRVGYGVDYRYWTAGYQPKHGIADLDAAAREGAGRWLREPQRTA